MGVERSSRKRKRSDILVLNTSKKGLEWREEEEKGASKRKKKKGGFLIVFSFLK